MTLRLRAEQAGCASAWWVRCGGTIEGASGPEAEERAELRDGGSLSSVRARRRWGSRLSVVAFGDVDERRAAMGASVEWVAGDRLPQARAAQ